MVQEFKDSIGSLLALNQKSEFEGIPYSSIYTHAGQVVTSRTAIQHETVYACIKVLAEACGQLPLEVYRNGSKIESGRQWHILAKQPCDYQTTQEWVETAVTALMLKGNFYCLIYRSPLGITKIEPFRYQDSVTVDMDNNGVVYYTYTANNGSGGLNRQSQVTYSQRDIFHLKLNNLDGFKGISPIQAGARAIGTALSQDSHQANTMSNSATPRGLLYTDQIFKDRELLTQHQKEWQTKYGGSANSGKTPILDGGLKYVPMAMSAADAQLLEQRQFSREQIAQIFQVPLHKLGVTGAIKYGTVEQANIAFMRDALIPILTKIENNLNLLLNGNLSVKFNEMEFVRGDYGSQTKAVGEQLKLGLISVNEGRKQLGYEPVEGGDVHAVDTNNLTFNSFANLQSNIVGSEEEEQVDDNEAQ